MSTDLFLQADLRLNECGDPLDDLQLLLPLLAGPNQGHQLLQEQLILLLQLFHLDDNRDDHGDDDDDNNG